MKHLGLQLWTIRDVFKTEEEVKFAFDELAKYGYTEIEPAGFPIDPVRFAELARAAGLRIIATHYSWDEIMDNTDAAIELHKMLGAKYIGVGGRYRQYQNDPQGLVDKVNDVGPKLANAGFKFSYHNHSWEFVKVNGRTFYSYLSEGFDPRWATLELDTYWAQHGGMDVCALMKKIAGKMDLVHLKDMAAHLCRDGENPDITECGNGNLNFTDIIPLAEKLGVEDFIVEQDRNFRISPLDSARESAEYLRANFEFC